MTSKPGSLADYQILVTGDSGFLGRRIVRKLLDEGACVVGIDLTPFPREFRKETNVGGALIHRIGDLRAIEFVNRIVEEVYALRKGNSAVIHLAGLSHAGQCEEDPLLAFQNNVLQTAQLLETCRKTGIKRFLFPSTALVYGENFASLLKEDHPANPRTVYASTKLAAEAVIQGYSGSYSFSCDIARLGNVYGADANQDTAVSTALRQARRGGPVQLRNLSAVRDFIYCEDVAEGFMRLLIAGEEPGCRIFNLSTGQGTSIGDMARMVCAIAGIKDEIFESGVVDKSQSSMLVLDNDKLIKRTDWRPAFSISIGLRAAWEGMNG